MLQACGNYRRYRVSRRLLPRCMSLAGAQAGSSVLPFRAVWRTPLLILAVATTPNDNQPKQTAFSQYSRPRRRIAAKLTAQA